MARTSLLTALVAVLLAVTATPAAAASTIVEVADALRRDPVFVDPDAELAIGDDDADRLRDEIRGAGTPIFVAVVPGSLGDAQEVAIELRRESGLSGTYAVVAGNQFRASSDTVRDAAGAASAAFQRSRDGGAAAVLLTFVESVGERGSSGGDGGAATTSERDTTDQPSAMPLLLLAGAGLGGFMLLRNRGNRRRVAERRVADESDRQMLRAELSVLADDVLRLEPDVRINERARPDYEAAVQRYRAAEAALEYADEAVDLVRVQRVVDEGRYAMSRARAILDGREPPAPPPELQQPGRHDEPPLGVDARGEPAYVGYGGGFYGGGGWFGGGSGLFTGLMLGQMLGGFGGFGHHGDVIVNQGDDGGGWGDMGGGDFGGGDFGGGDFGGGDF